MSIYLGDKLLAGASEKTVILGFDLFDHKWSDHILNDISWLRADTFSWQSGELYKSAYEHLVEDLKAEYFYGWEEANDGIPLVWTKELIPADGTDTYDSNGVEFGTRYSKITYANGERIRTLLGTFFRKPSLDFIKIYNEPKFEGCTPWTQPVLTGATTSTDLGNVVVSSSSNYSGYDAYKAMNGVKSGTNASTGWGVNNTSAVHWWQVKFPYKIRITGLKCYQRYDSTPNNANTIGQFYTSNEKTIAIGDEYNNVEGINWNEVSITGIPEDGIITDTIYFEKTGGGNYGGLGEIEIIAERLVSNHIVKYYQSEDGHKIVTPDQESVVQAIYEETGVAWYYILDVANKRFKLPRELPITDKSKGNGMTLGLTKGDTNYGLTTWNTTNEKATTARTTGYGLALPSSTKGTSGTYPSDGDNLGITTDPTMSGIISHRANANGQQYLYFYVGNYTKSAIEQTAGVTTEVLNDKLDTDLGNVTATTKETVVGWGVPDYSAGVVLSYTTTNTNFPSSGIAYFGYKGASNTSANIYINDISFGMGGSSAGNINTQTAYIVSKEDVYRYQTESNGQYGVFYPFKGVN